MCYFAAFKKRDYIGEIVNINGRSAEVLFLALCSILHNSFTEIADSYFDEIAKEDIPELLVYYGHCVNVIKNYLRKRALQEEITTKNLQKIYYWHFYGKDIESDALFDLVSQTYKHVGVDFLYDCIVMIPFHDFKGRLLFYRDLLNLAIQVQVKVRSSVLWKAKIDEHRDLSGRMGKKKQENEISFLIDAVTREGLVYDRAAVNE